MSVRVKISPEKLVWATERGGYTTDSLVDLYPKAIEWIREEAEPTIKQLESFAKKVQVPFGFLFLKEPPVERLPLTFYRSNGEVVKNPPLIIKDLVSSVKIKQDWVKDYLIENNYEKLDFIGSLKDYNNIEHYYGADIIRQSLNLEKYWFKKVSKSQAFRFWIDKIEESRVFVISTGFVGNNRRPVDVEICKGLTLIDDFAPFIYINTNNLGGGRIFTLIHELVHVFVGKSLGVSYNPIHPASKPLEKFCDAVASEILVPSDEFKIKWKEIKGDFVSKYNHLSSYFHVSKLVIAKKALDNNYIQTSDFWNFYNFYTSISYKKSSGGQYWNTKPYEVSRKFFNFIDRALSQGKILPSNAYKLTNMKGKTYDKFKSMS